MRPAHDAMVSSLGGFVSFARFLPQIRDRAWMRARGDRQVMAARPCLGGRPCARLHARAKVPALE